MITVFIYLIGIPISYLFMLYVWPKLIKTLGGAINPPSDDDLMILKVACIFWPFGFALLPFPILAIFILLATRILKTFDKHVSDKKSIKNESKKIADQFIEVDN